MNKTTKYLVGSTVFFALMSAVLTVTTIYYAKKDNKGDAVDLSANNTSCDPCNQSQSEAKADKAGVQAKSTQDEHVTKFREMKVLGFELDKDKAIVKLSENPDIKVLKEYVSIEPAPKGGISYSIGSSEEYSYSQRAYVKNPTLELTGDFAFRTNLVLKIRKGLPINPSAYSTNVVLGALSKDYVHTFCRQDAPTSVSFTSSGRYLAPIGARSLEVESINVTNICASVFRIPYKNIVHLLAIEETKYDGIYKSYYNRGDEFAKNFGVKETSKIETKLNGALNKLETTTFSLNDISAEITNGVFLVTLNGSGYESSSKLSDSKVVVVSDLALSVRETATNSVVWVTSLTTGAPVSGVNIEVYSKENVLVGKGTADDNGLCILKRDPNSPPFVVVASRPDGSDATFVALADSSRVAENYDSGDSNRSNNYRPRYLQKNELVAYAWTDRGIYRHGEKLLLHAIVRNDNFKAPDKVPVEIILRDAQSGQVAKKTVVTDAYGAIVVDDIVIPDNRPSGSWYYEIRLPSGVELYRGKFNVEDFVPPQVRVKVVADKKLKPQDFAFDVEAEYFYGGVASGLKCEGAVVFEDAAFAPENWPGWVFGDSTRSLTPDFNLLPPTILNEKGKARISAPMPCTEKDNSLNGLPAAAVRVTAQGAVFDDGGRASYSRDTATLHYYPYYIGTTLKKWIKNKPGGKHKISLACVTPDGKRLSEDKNLIATLTRIDSVYSYGELTTGRNTWRCQHVRTDVATDIAITVKADSDTVYEMPVLACGDYELSIKDPASNVSFASSFYVSDWGSESLSAPLSNPAKVSLKADKNFYVPGDKPKLCVRAPFAGKALLGVFHNNMIYTEVITLTNVTSEIELRAITADMVPNIDVSISVVHGISADSGHLAARAHGEVSLNVRLPEKEIKVGVKAEYEKKKVLVSLNAPGASEAIVTVVDEAVNLLTNQKTPNPNAEFFKPRSASRYLYDLYNRLLPLAGEDKLLVNGLKTGGGACSDLFGRVSPVKSRRFKPLARWKKNIKLNADGKALCEIELPEFAGEVRVSAVAYSQEAVGAASIQCKISPKVVVSPDAPRFVAPGDKFNIILPFKNCSGKDGTVAFKIFTSFDGSEKKLFQEGEVHLKKDCSKTLPYEITAPDKLGQMVISFETKSCDEEYFHEIELPVRPAVAWRQTSGVEVLPTGKRFKLPKGKDGLMTRFNYSVSESPVAELKDALEWLADYPYGCLEQTTSRVFPLISAGGILNAFSSVEASNRVEYIQSAVRRIESMYDCWGFYPWPDVSENVDAELSLYVMHFLFEAKNASVEIKLYELSNCIRMLQEYARSSENNYSSAAYACYILALADEPDRGRMYSLYDERSSLSILSRARLARAFACVGDRVRAKELLNSIKAPSNIKEASFVLLAMLDVDPENKKVAELVQFLSLRRSKGRYSWGTTSENAHALLALAEYFRRQPITLGLSNVKEENSELSNIGSATAFVTWKRLDLPKADEVKPESNGIKIRREFFTADGKPYDMANAKRGDYVIARIVLSSDDEREFSDLVIEDLFSAAFEPILNSLLSSNMPWMGRNAHGWVLHKEFRDDRALIFSNKFKLAKGEEVKFHYPLRVVSSGTFTLPGVAVEAMYQPELRANTGCERVVVRD